MSINRIATEAMPYASPEFKAAILASEEHRWNCVQCKKARVLKSSDFCEEGRRLLHEAGKLATPEWLALKSDWTIN